MSYRSRLYNHRNVQSPEIGEKKPFFSKQQDSGNGKVKFFQTGKPADANDKDVQRLATSTEDEKVGTNEERMKRDKEDKVKTVQRAVAGAGANSTTPETSPPPEVNREKSQPVHEMTSLPQSKKNEKIQRDLAIEPANPNAVDPELSTEKIRNAIIFNRERYSPQSISLIQNVVGATVTGTMDEETIRLIAHYQAQNNLSADGMVGPNTFNQLTSELSAEGASPDDCLTMFQVSLKTPMEIHPGNPGRVNIFGRFDVEIRFSPHCDCSRFEYRQFIGGDVTLNGVNINNTFAVPGGGLPGLGNFVEDGNVSLPSNGRFGHRNLPPNQQALNQYTEADGQALNMASGCMFSSFDEPGVDAEDIPGNTFVFDFRFFGDIIKDGKMVERKFWAVRDTVRIP